jgi:transglutaminase-like putative cysteine protease
MRTSFNGGVLRSVSVACDLIPYPLLLKEKGDACDAAPVGPPFSFRRRVGDEVAGHKHPQSRAKALVLASFAILASLALLAAAPAAAAEFPPISAEERALTAVPGEPNAPAVVLFRKGEFLMAGYGALHGGNTSTLRVQVRMKILTEAGKNNGEVVIAHTGGERLHGFHGRTVLPDGRIVPVAADARFLRKTSALHETFTTSVVFPAVTVGAILDYEFELGFDDIFYLEPWIFSAEVPVRYAEVVFRTPLDLAVQVWSRALAGVQVKRDQTAAGYATRAWVENLPPVPEDPYGPPFRDLAAQMLLLPTARNAGVNHQPLFDSWKSTCELIGRAYDRFRRPDEGVAQQARTIVGSAASPRDKAAALYRFVRDQIENEPSQGVLPDPEIPLEKVLAARKADRAEKGLLLEAMLHAAGVDSRLVWAADRDRVTIDPQLPSPSWFDTLLVRVVLDGQPVYLDPSDPSLGFGGLRGGHEGTAALLYDTRKPEMITLPETPFYKSLRRAEIDLVLGADGRLAGTGTLRLTGQRAWRTIGWQEGEAKAAEEWKEWLEKRFKDFQVAAVQVVPSIEDSTVTVTWTLAQRPEEALGDEASIVPSVPLGPLAQPFVQPAADRRTGVVFDELYRDEVELKLRWPAGWQLDAKPQEKNLTAKAVSISSHVEVNAAGRTLIYKRRFDISQRQIATSQEYENIRGLFAEVEKNDAQKLVLVRH